MPGARPSTLYISYNPPNSHNRRCHYYPTLQKLTCKEALAEHGKGTRNWFSENPGRQWGQPSFILPTKFGGLAPKWNFQIHPKGKEKALSQKEDQAPFLKTAYSDAVVPQIPVSMRSRCSSKISNFSKSVKSACVKLTHTIKPTGFFLWEFILKVCRNALFQQELK